MKKQINSSWYKITADELKNKKYLKRDISELIKEAGYKERVKTKIQFLPRVLTSSNIQKNKEETLPRKYINYLHTNFRKRAKSNKQKSLNKKDSIIKNEGMSNKEKIMKIYKRNINKDELKKEDEICFYCLSYLEDPILLECSHKICKKCLDEMILFDKFLKINGDNIEIKVKKSPSEIFGINNFKTQ